MTNSSLLPEMTLTWTAADQTIRLSATADGLTRFTPADSIFQSDHWTSPIFTPCGNDARIIRKTQRILENAHQQLHHYGVSFQESFGIPYAPQGTTEEVAVWNALAYVPYGTFISIEELYAALADTISLEIIRTALLHNPLPIFIPSHRVLDIGSQAPAYFARLRDYEVENPGKASI